MPTDSQRFLVCPKCGLVAAVRPWDDPPPWCNGGTGGLHHAKIEPVPATVIVLPRGEPSDEQVERATKAAAQVSRMMRLSGTADRNERSEAAARAVIRALASPDERTDPDGP